MKNVKIIILISSFALIYCNILISDNIFTKINSFLKYQILGCEKIRVIHLPDTLTVGPNHDFSTIQAAVNAANPYDDIVVYPGTYDYFSFSGIDHLDIWAFSNYSATIDGDTETIVVDMDDADYSTLTGFNITGTGDYGINCEDTEYAEVRYNDIELVDTGIYIMNSYEFKFEHNEIHDTENGIHIDRTSSNSVSAKLDLNEVFDNDVGLQIDNSYGTAHIVTINSILLYDNTYEGISFGGTYGSTLNMDNSTITGNDDGIGFQSNSSATIVNSIVYDNISDSFTGSPSSLSVTYSCIEDGYTGTGNTDEDPYFTNPSNNDYTLLWNENHFSPCIDTGDPNSLFYDDDGTPADMGYYPAIDHRFDKWKLPTAEEHHGIKWMSLPALDDLTNSTEYDGDMAAYLLEDILSFTILDTIIWKPLEEEKMRLYFVTDPGYWENDDHIFTSPQGYKFKMFPELEESVPLNISGFHADTLTIIDLCGDGEENWIGYFCDKTQKLRNAFGQIWDNIAAIKTQHWSVVRITQGEEEWLGDIIKPTLSYGDMVIVKCYDDDSFIWNNYFGPGDTYNRPETEHFDFVEELDYIPVFIEHDPNDLPTEVGLFINDICKGAAVVEGDQTQVNGYIMNNESEELSVHYYYDDRSEIKTIDNYQILDPVTMLKEEGKIIVDPAEDYYYVSFNEKNDYTLLDTELQINVFPNPFIINDRDQVYQTISYSIPDDSFISVNIYNLKGQLVKHIFEGDQISGEHQIYWNGKDNNGQNTGTGIYLYKIETNNKVFIRKIMLIR